MPYENHPDFEMVASEWSKIPRARHKETELFWEPPVGYNKKDYALFWCTYGVTNLCGVKSVMPSNHAFLKYVP